MQQLQREKHNNGCNLDEEKKKKKKRKEGKLVPEKKKKINITKR